MFWDLWFTCDMLILSSDIVWDLLTWVLVSYRHWYHISVHWCSSHVSKYKNIGTTTMHTTFFVLWHKGHFILYCSNYTVVTIIIMLLLCINYFVFFVSRSCIFVVCWILFMHGKVHLSADVQLLLSVGIQVIWATTAFVIPLIDLFSDKSVSGF